MDFSNSFRGKQELSLPCRSKPLKPLSSFLQKVKTPKTNDLRNVLAKSLLSQSQEEDTLKIRAPTKLDGFQPSRAAKTPRDLLTQQLRSAINQRKTYHISTELAFDKSKSELLGFNKQAQSENDSDFEPEKQEAEELKKMIDLQGEFDRISHESEESVEENQQDFQDVEIVENEEKEVQMNQERVQLDQLQEEMSQNLSQQNQEILQEKYPLQGFLSNPQISTAADTSTVGDISPSLQNMGSIVQNTKKTSIFRFIDNLAELGSDHSQHDDFVKRESEFQQQQDGILEDLIDTSKIQEREKKLAQKHMGDMIAQDHFNIQKVINADFKRRRSDLDYLQDSPGMESKKVKLMRERQKLLAGREYFNNVAIDTAMNESESDSQEQVMINLGRERLELKRISSISTDSVIDDQSRSYLSLIKKPERIIKATSLLNQNSQSNGKTVYQGYKEMNSTKTFSFSRNPQAKQNIPFHKRKTRLFKHLNSNFDQTIYKIDAYQDLKYFVIQIKTIYQRIM